MCRPRECVCRRSHARKRSNYRTNPRMAQFSALTSDEAYGSASLPWRQPPYRQRLAESIWLDLVSVTSASGSTSRAVLRDSEPAPLTWPSAVARVDQTGAPFLRRIRTQVRRHGSLLALARANLTMAPLSQGSVEAPARAEPTGLKRPVSNFACVTFGRYGVSWRSGTTRRGRVFCGP